MVSKVDFVSAPGISEPGVYRRGGPYAMVTRLGVFGFDRERRRFNLRSVHPGHSVEEILDNTGFELDVPARCEFTRVPDIIELELIRSQVREEVAAVYPRFAAEL